MTSAVLDASAVLALLRGELGAALVQEVVSTRVAISAVNLCEVVTKATTRGVSEALLDELRDLDLQVVPFDEAAAYASGALHRETRPLGLSLADCACLALARWMDAPAVTADRLWSRVDDVEVVVIR